MRKAWIRLYPNYLHQQIHSEMTRALARYFEVEIVFTNYFVDGENVFPFSCCDVELAMRELGNSLSAGIVAKGCPLMEGVK